MHFNKVARLFSIGIVMDPVVESEFVRARNQLDMRTHELLKSFPARVAQAKALGMEDAGETVHAEDQTVLKPLVDAKVDAEKRLDAATVEFKFRALGRKKYRELTAKYPATDKQIQAAKDEGRPAHEMPSVNHDLFAPELVAAAIVSPTLSRDEVLGLWDSEEWNEPELGLLYRAAHAPQVDLGQHE